jgi:predicted DNA-binding antitoxin AbrB/MazE fold protein
MPITVEAVYECGVLKPAEPLPLREHEHVSVTIQTGGSPLLRAYGLVRWNGAPDILRRLALSPTLDLEEDS